MLGEAWVYTHLDFKILYLPTCVHILPVEKHTVLTLRLLQKLNHTIITGSELIFHTADNFEIPHKRCVIQN